MSLNYVEYIEDPLFVGTAAVGTVDWVEGVGAMGIIGVGVGHALGK